MKHILKLFLIFLVFSIPINLFSQVGINTETIDPSSALEIFSEDKGLLMPRLTTTQRDGIIDPASGLMIYNITSNDGQINTGTPTDPVWEGIKSQQSSCFVQSLTKGNDVTTESLEYVLVPEMKISPAAGTYLTLFNGEISSNQTFSTEQAVLDLNSMYTALMAYPGVAHGLTFGGGEILLPGVYDVTGAPSIAETLTLDGNGDSDALFIIRGTGAFTTGASTTVILTNGARPNNVFWVSGAAMSTGAGTTIEGTFVAKNAAIALGANTKLTGRLFSTLGAITMGATSKLLVPCCSSKIDFGVLNSFVIFSANGGISGCPDCTITGDVGTGLGAPTDFGGINGTVFPPGTTTTPNVSSYSIYKNDIEVLESSRTIFLSATVALQAMVTVEEGQEIQVRWKVSKGGATLHHRILSLIRAGN